MNSKKVQDWLQVVGLFGVIASLIFVGLEMRQAQKIAMSQANQARADATANLLLAAAENPTFLSGTAKLVQGQAADMTPEELAARRLVTAASLFHYENLYLQYREGFVTDERWNGSRENLKIALRTTDENASRAVFERAPST